MAGSGIHQPTHALFDKRPLELGVPSLWTSTWRSLELQHCRVQVPRVAPVRLYTATLVHCCENEIIHGFYAVVDTAMSHLFCKLLSKLGPEAAGQATLAQGFDPSDPLIVSLVSDALADMLVLIDAEPASPLANGLDIQFESRFRLN